MSPTRRVPAGSGSSASRTRNTGNARKQVNPRKPPGRQPRKDRTTVVLALAAVVLLILVILLLDRRIVSALFPARSAAVENEFSAPVIERIEEGNVSPGAAEPVVELGIPEQPAGTEQAPAEVTSPPALPGGTTARLFFIRVSDDGNISVKSVLRPLEATDSPLTASINALISGPKPGELSNDVLSLIPEGSRLLGARIEGGVAFLDFNEQFRFNALGLEGYRAQIEQVVYTATEFSSVDKVQILIEGQRIDYLGGEGFRVGAPLGREDF